jgi:hypothetical protein
MRFYVLVRQRKPEGDLQDIKRTLDKEGPQVEGVLKKYDVRVDGFIPSQDGSRFMAFEDAPIPPENVAAMKRDLQNIGYDVTDPIEGRRAAAIFWKSGKKPSDLGIIDRSQYGSSFSTSRIY